MTEETTHSVEGVVAKQHARPDRIDIEMDTEGGGVPDTISITLKA